MSGTAAGTHPHCPFVPAAAGPGRPRSRYMSSGRSSFSSSAAWAAASRATGMRNGEQET